MKGSKAKHSRHREYALKRTRQSLRIMSKVGPTISGSGTRSSTRVATVANQVSSDPSDGNGVRPKAQSSEQQDLNSEKTRELARLLSHFGRPRAGGRAGEPMRWYLRCNYCWEETKKGEVRNRFSVARSADEGDKLSLSAPGRAKDLRHLRKHMEKKHPIQLSGIKVPW